MAAIVAINYLMAKWMGKASPQNSRNRLIAIVGVNVLILAFFKYFNFFSPYLLFLSKIAQGSIGRSGQLIPQQCKIMNDFIL